MLGDLEEIIDALRLSAREEYLKKLAV
jgi:hypothetical protein